MEVSSPGKVPPSSPMQLLNSGHGTLANGSHVREPAERTTSAERLTAALSGVHARPSVSAGRRCRAPVLLSVSTARQLGGGQSAPLGCVGAMEAHGWPDRLALSRLAASLPLSPFAPLGLDQLRAATAAARGAEAVLKVRPAPPARPTGQPQAEQ